MINREKLKALWAEAFGDSKEYIQGFFDLVFEETVCLTDSEEDPGSALYLISGALYGYRTEYLFAAATKRELQGQGRMSFLIRKAIQRAQEQSLYLFTVPATESLVSFYRRFGFQSLPAWDIVGQAPKMQVRLCTLEEWQAHYRPRSHCWESGAGFRRFCLEQEKENLYLIEEKHPVVGEMSPDGDLRVKAGYVPTSSLVGIRSARCPLMIFCPRGMELPEDMEAWLLQND